MIRGLKVLAVLSVAVFGFFSCTTMQTTRNNIPVVSGVMHTVGENETLNAIAKTYEVSSQLLIRRNNLREGDVLQPGVRLFIPGAKDVLEVNVVESDTTIQEERDGLFHRVGPGETLIAIANAYKVYGVTIEELQRVNNLPDPSRIYIGQELWIPRAKQVMDVEIPKVEIVSAQPLKQHQNPPDPRVVEKVKPVKKSTSSPVTKDTSQNTAASSQPPVKKPTPTPTPVEFPRKIKEYGSIKFQWPIKDSFQVLKGYSKVSGNLNPGIDLGADIGTEISAAADGEVLMVGGVTDSLGTGFGNHIILYHGDRNNKEIYTVYAHNSQNLVKVGQRVKRGQLIAKMGNTGRTRVTEGGVLHFEIREQIDPIDPLKVLPPLN